MGISTFKRDDERAQRRNRGETLMVSVNGSDKAGQDAQESRYYSAHDRVTRLKQWTVFSLVILILVISSSLPLGLCHMEFHASQTPAENTPATTRLLSISLCMIEAQTSTYLCYAWSRCIQAAMSTAKKQARLAVRSREVVAFRCIYM